jgi:hypothetical protein
MRGRRSDAARFFFARGDEEWARVPISYLVKLALADVVGSAPDLPPAIRQTGKRLLRHFSNDNTSPETHSFHVVPAAGGVGLGRALARETAKRFLLTHLLTLYANERFQMAAHGQRAEIYFAPHPPVRQKELNEWVSDAFYRDLFMSPCLSGWDEGEAKQQYMHLCHQVLSRSQLNGVAKLREAGIITSNLVVLPNLSNISLANNGTHVSLGSRRLAGALADPASGFAAAHEKRLGDLAIKVVEHFLPLFVGTFSAAPYRLDFADFHAERALGFLPHELDYTHLRMLWRRWRKKARLKIFGQPVTPFGPIWLDRALGRVPGLRGDLVPDFRLIDYPVALLSTDQSPALDGALGSEGRLKQDLAALGVFDARMALYLPFRLRQFEAAGFSGFEGRHYSLFEGFEEDLAPAVDLQLLVVALAFKLMALGRVDHAHIPDDPTVESERRQIFFAAAIGIPTVFVRRDTPNAFLRGIVARTRGVRASRRYPGYLRVPIEEYRRSLLRLLREEAADLIEALGLAGALRDLALRLDEPDERSTAARLTRAILAGAGVRSPLHADARAFNLAAERYYRGRLRRRHLAEALGLLEQDLRLLDRAGGHGTGAAALRAAVGDRAPGDVVAAATSAILGARAAPADVARLIHLLLISIHHGCSAADAVLGGGVGREADPAPVYRTA